eukprot:TRINITY_DN13877_c0_g2_i1.p1 TRINITY_DN13877_c0_g2~~TRINITY_DN13877_c0_g2_i1.p1  ORF type:complete len:191 (-),score=21.05 TRINITY_DN13877_c0_g2_i1:133-705(-)
MPPIHPLPMTVLSSLAICSGKYAAYAHLEDVHVVTLPRGSSTSEVKHQLLPPIKSSVTQVKWCHVRDKEYLVVTSVSGVQVWNVEGAKVTFWHAVGAETGTPSWKPFLRGITSFNVGDESFILVGSSTGDILVFSVDASGTVALNQTLRGGHQVPICEMDTEVSGDKATVCIHSGPPFPSFLHLEIQYWV